MSPRTELPWALPARPTGLRPELVSCARSDLASETVPEPAWEEIHGHGPIVVRFSVPLSPTMYRDGEDYIFALSAFGVQGCGASPSEAERCAADCIAADVNHLTRTFPDLLTKEERARRSALLSYVDLLGGDIGIDFPTDRRLLGHLRGALFVPLQEQDFAPIPVPPSFQKPDSGDTLWLARVATYRDGRPKGEVLELTPASGERA